MSEKGHQLTRYSFCCVWATADTTCKSQSLANSDFSLALCAGRFSTEIVARLCLEQV